MVFVGNLLFVNSICDLVFDKKNGCLILVILLGCKWVIVFFVVVFLFSYVFEIVFIFI